VPLVWMMRDARSWVLYDAMLGKWIMLYRKTPAAIIGAGADHDWDPSDWVDPLPELDRTASDKIIARVNVRFMRDWNLTDSLESYKGIKSAGSGAPTADEKYVCRFVRDGVIAQALADFYLAWDGVATRTTNLVLVPSEMDVQKGDVAAVTMPIGGSDPLAYVQGVNGTKFVVEGQGWSPGSLRDGRPTTVVVLLREVPTT